MCSAAAGNQLGYMSTAVSEVWWVIGRWMLFGALV